LADGAHRSSFPFVFTADVAGAGEGAGGREATTVIQRLSRLVLIIDRTQTIGCRSLNVELADDEQAVSGPFSGPRSHCSYVGATTPSPQ
jgi:hypothetical protein